MSITDHKTTDGSHEECLGDDCVLIAGGGPVGLVLATTLASYGVKSVLLERNETTTKWPKMDLTNARSMELFRSLGLADKLREQGVPSHIPYTVRISTGLNEEENITAWYHPSVDKYREEIAAKNDGTMPLEPYQRLSQSIFEAWLKKICDENPLIDLRFGNKVESVEETEEGANLTVSDVRTGQRSKITSRYTAACDGASSRIRRGLAIPLDGGLVPTFSLLIHFKSRDLTRLHRQGQFWHIFFIGNGVFSGAIIAQDEKDTWTTHLQLPLDTDPDTISSEDAVYTVLGGCGAKYEVTIDEILVRSTYRPSIAVARQYISPNGFIYLAGDSAHQNIPTGGYGMNMGLGDAFDLGWKLATVMKGHGGPALLRAYEQDRRPVALKTIERSGVHITAHMTGGALLPMPYAELNSAAGEAAKEQVRKHYAENDGENRDLGIEMDYRYNSPICIPCPTMDEPAWLPSTYTPSTNPGSRAPHVFLSDGTAIFDKYGKYFSLVVFPQAGATENSVKLLLEAGAQNNVPVELVTLANEDNACKVWGNVRLVLVRPDGHVAWRAQHVPDAAAAASIIRVVAGLVDGVPTGERMQEGMPEKAFTSTVEVMKQDVQYELARMGAFQT